MSSAQGAPPGWYPDPSGRAAVRWWDGRAWSQHVSEEAPGHPPDAQPPGPDAPTPTATEPVTGTEPAPPPEPSESASERDVPPDRRRRRRGRRLALMAGSGAALLVAVFLLGVVAGWGWLDGREGTPFAGSGEVEVVEIRVPALGTEGAGAEMPDVRGLPRDVALEVLADAVPDADEPVVESRPWAGEPGVVIEQRPAFGSPQPVAVSLVVAEQAVVPEVAGRDLEEMVAALESLGTRVEVARRFEAGTTSDTVLEASPAPGEPLPPSVSLVASERPATMFLATLPLVEGRCGGGNRAVDGVAYDNVLECRVVDDEDTAYAWLLGRAVDRVEGTIGLPDDGPTGLVVLVDVLVDGTVVSSHEVVYGQGTDIEVPTSGGLRLTVRARIAGEEPEVTRAELILADLRLVGGNDALAELRDGE